MTPTEVIAPNICLTQGVHKTIEEQPELAPFVYESLEQHISGDWGDVDKNDRQVNKNGLANKGRIVSVYKLGEPRTVSTLYGTLEVDRLWIITDPGWATTTILWPVEY